MSEDRSPSERRRPRLPGRGRARCAAGCGHWPATHRGRARDCVSGRPAAPRAPRPRREPGATVWSRRGCVPPTAPAS